MRRSSNRLRLRVMVVLASSLILLVSTSHDAVSVGLCGVAYTYKTPTDQVTSANLNANFLQAATTNSTPQCVQGDSASLAQMQATVDPFPAQVESLATTLEGEVQRLRSVIRTLTGWTQWYSTNQRITLPNALTVNNTGPHAIGGAAVNTSIAGYGLFVTGSQSPTASTAMGGTSFSQALSPAAGASAALVYVGLDSGAVATVITRAASGTHPDLVSLQVQNFTLAGTGATITNASSIKVAGAPTGATNNYALWVAGGTTRLDGSLQLSTSLLVSSTAPTISSGFGTSASVTVNNGTVAFRINVGTGGTATSGVIGLPTAANGWNCNATDITTNSSTVFVTKQTASTTTTATIGNFNTSAVAAAWVASDILAVQCVAL